MSQQQARAQPRIEGSVAPAFPLALLESVRSHDRPDEVLEDEEFTVSLPRRLGLTGVVGTQISRYEAAQRAGRDVSAEEVMSLIRLVLRRPDAEPILRETGQRIARWRFRRVPLIYTSVLHRAPNRLGMRSARRGVRRLLRALRLGRQIEVAKPCVVRISEPALATLEADNAGCTLVTSLLEETVLRFTGERAVFVHDACVARGAAACTWSIA
jgi:hypothetical protein